LQETAKSKIKIIKGIAYFILPKLMKMDHNIKLITDADFIKIDNFNFNEIALSVFRFQYLNNRVYNAFCNVLNKNPQNVNSIEKIPFMPVALFKSNKVITGNFKLPDLYFESSSTTSDVPATHYVHNAALYDASLLSGFINAYGSPSQYVILALLPSYLQRNHASLVYMANVLMKESNHPENGFFLHHTSHLKNILLQLEAQGKSTLLLGVTFALLDFAQEFPMPLSHTIVMETGGMKGRKKELTRNEVHDILKSAWGLTQIHSEYGMTEMLSQAYSHNAGLFNCSNTMKVLCRDVNDPFEISLSGKGCLNIIDLANLYSCSFLATDDIGEIHENGSFQVNGRMDNSALRGCSLMAI